MLAVHRLFPLLLVLCLTGGAFAASVDGEDTWTWAPDYPEGARLPDFEALDTQGNPVQVADLSGDRGMLLFFNRSTDW